MFNMLSLSRCFAFGLILLGPSLCFDEETFKADIKQGILQLHHDTEMMDTKQNTLEYFPIEIEELVPQIQKYFLGKQKGYQTPQTAKFLECTACVAGVDTLNGLFQMGVNMSAIETIAIELCSVVLDANVCAGAISNYFPQVKYLAEHDAVDGGLFCALALGGHCGYWTDVYEWEVDFPDVVPKPPFVAPTPPEENAPTTKVLHISDIHLDLSYKIGTDTDCGLPMCCMNYTKMADDPDKAAGYWGAYYCDLPVWTFEDMLSQIKEKFSDGIDYIMLTGDYPAHDVWLQSKDNNKQHAKVATDLVKKYFPDSNILPSLGNHEAFPCNSFAVPSVDDPELNATWIYDYLGEYFSDWLPEEAQVTFSDGGFYTYLLRPGFRIITINSILNLGYNFWTNLDYQDPGNSLLWMYDVLLNAEENNEKVHIISHAPTNTEEFVSGWAKQYSKMIDRFANTVTGQFNGHTHNDEYTLFYDYETNTVPINVAFVTPSVTTFTGLNPSFRQYTLDGPYEGASMRVIDVDTYIFNLTAANLNNGEKRPEYFKLYNHRDDLEMENLFPSDFDQLARRMADDDAMYERFFRYFNSDSWGDAYDKEKVICKMVSSCALDQRKCHEIMG